jgi:hypothetical protein
MKPRYLDHGLQVQKYGVPKSETEILDSTGDTNPKIHLPQPWRGVQRVCVGVVSSRPSKPAVCTPAHRQRPTDLNSADRSCKGAGHRPTKTPAEQAATYFGPAPPRRVSRGPGNPRRWHTALSGKTPDALAPHARFPCVDVLQTGRRLCAATTEKPCTQTKH